MKVVLATKNQGKLRELTQMASAAKWLELVLAPDQFDPEETGSTFEENAIIKAKECARMTGMISIADDSGLAVDALDGAPGIYSARYCQGTDRDKRLKLLHTMDNIAEPLRAAAFVCAMAVCDSRGEIIYSTLARWPGVIAFDERGENGFGYDPIFYLPEKGRTSAELTSEEKNEISHRALAWKKVIAFLNDQ